MTRQKKLARQDMTDEGLNDKTQTLAREDITDEWLNDKNTNVSQVRYYQRRVE